jgi:alanine or glycine:cation symporter, AGCS family
MVGGGIAIDLRIIIKGDTLESLTGFLDLLDSFLGSARYFPFVLLGTGLVFTVYLKFPQIRFFRQALRR